MKDRGGLGSRLLAAALWLFPPAFRREHGEEIARVLREGAADIRRRKGARAVPGYWAAALADVVGSALAERRQRRSDERGGVGMEDWMRDVRHAARGLRRSPGFTAVVLITLALGIGANTAIFSVVRAVLLAPLPYPEGERLVMVWGAMTNRDVFQFPHSPPDLRDYRELSTAFDEVAGVFTFNQALNAADGAPQQIVTAGVTPNFFRTLGVRPLLGRDFVADDGTPTEPGAQPGDPGFLNNATLLSHALWQQRFGGNPDVVGTMVDIAGFPTEIVGVLPQGFELLLPEASNTARRPEAFVALRLDFDNAPRNNVFLQAVARLAPGVGVDQARQEMDQVAADIRSRVEGWNSAGFDLSVEPLADELVAPVRPVVVALMSAVGFVLLIACANVANLLLVRGSRREREVAVRVAMGGARSRIVREILAESFLLALGGAVVGLGVAHLGIGVLQALGPENLPRIDDVAIDGAVLAFTAGAALIAAVAFGLVPGLRASRPDLAAVLKDRGRSLDLRSQRLLRGGVVVTEVALGTVILVGAGLMTRSFMELRQVEPGWDPTGVLTFNLPTDFGRYPGAGERAILAASLQERLAALPGVRRASAVFPLPLGGSAFNGRWGLADALSDPSAFRQADYQAVLPAYFETMGTEILEGRGFQEADQRDSLPVVVVDRSLAEAAFPGESAVGREIYVRVVTPEAQAVRIVGVVEPQRLTALARPGRATIFYPDHYVGSFASAWILETDAPPEALAGPLRAAVAEVDPRIPVADLRPMSAYVDDAMGPTRFALVLLASFAGLALVLACVGLYGVLAYVVGQRTPEIGVRMAFGARSGGILRLVLRQGLVLTVAGVVVGLLGARALTGYMGNLLVGVSAYDPATYVTVALVFLTVAVAACVIPALRASHVDPVVALRDE